VPNVTDRETGQAKNGVKVMSSSKLPKPFAGEASLKKRNLELVCPVGTV
jgi:hypothetical protein